MEGRTGKRRGREEGKKKMSDHPRRSQRHKILVPAGAHKSVRSYTLPKSLFEPHDTECTFKQSKHWDGVVGGWKKPRRRKVLFLPCMYWQYLHPDATGKY